MKIACTVGEFAEIVSGCHKAMQEVRCSKCPLYDVCGNGSIEQFISACDISDDAEVEG